MDKSKHYHSTTPLRCSELYYRSSKIENALTPQYALVYISSGGVTYEDADNIFELSAGMAFQRVPEKEHLISYAAGTRSHFVAVPPEVYQMMLSLNLPTLTSTVINPGIKCGFVARQRTLQAQLQNEAPQLMMRTLTAMQQLIIDTHIQCIRIEGSIENLIIQACTLLSQNLDQPLSPEGVSESLGMGYSLFRKEFKKSCGISPGRYRIKKRIERAQQLLLIGNSISSIADELGYNDIYSFSAQFKKICRCSPSSYRQNFNP